MQIGKMAGPISQPIDFARTQCSCGWDIVFATQDKTEDEIKYTGTDILERHFWDRHNKLFRSNLTRNVKLAGFRIN